MLDRTDRMIHLDPTGLEVQRRFWTCHEIGHDLCPWHDARLYLDGASTLDPSVYVDFEEQANYAAIRLLFQQNTFSAAARDLGTNFRDLQRLAAHFGGSIHAAFRLFIETDSRPLAGYVLMPTASNKRARVKAAFASPSFRDRYDHLDVVPHYLMLDDCLTLPDAWHKAHLYGRIEAGRHYLPTRAGQHDYMRFELFTNTYNTFLLFHTYGRLS